MKQLIRRLSVLCVLTAMLLGMMVPVQAAGQIKQKTVSLYAGQSTQLTLTGLKKKVKKKVKWSSTNKKVATVSTKGKVKGMISLSKALDGRPHTRQMASDHCKPWIFSPNPQAIRPFLPPIQAKRADSAL